MSNQSGDDFDLLNTFAHDLKTPLSAVKSYIELIEQYGPLNERQAHFCNRALHGVERMQRTISELLDFARLEADVPLDMTETDLHQLVEDALDLVKEAINKKNIQVETHFAPELKPIMANARLLSHVVTNLVTNAVKYNRDDGMVRIWVIDEKTFVRVDVQDTGFGIDTEDQKRIFDRFFRARRDKRVRRVEGNGLGLAISRTVVRRHGGHIWVESVLDEGSTFSFTVPRIGSTFQIAQSETHRDREALNLRSYESASEIMDDLDDNLQESHEPSESDSRSDEV